MTRLLFCALALLYLATCSRDVYWFDSPEFTTTAIHLDISHPPGYPLWNLIAHLFTKLPVGPVPFRVAAFSAVAGAGAAALFLAFLLRMRIRPHAALAAACLLAFLHQYWSLAVIAEIYTFEMLLLAALLCSLAPDERGRPMPNVALSALLAGCLVAHRPSDALFLPFLLGLATISRGELPRAAGWFSLGYVPYIHTWWHLHNRPSMAYFDYPKDVTTFLGILTGKLYANNLFTLSLQDSLVELKNYLLLLARNFGPVMLVAAAAGMAIARWRRAPELMTILGIVMVNVVFCTNYNVIETNTMVLPSMAMLAWSIAIALDALLERAPRAALLVAAFPLLWVPWNYQSCDRSGFREVSRFLADLYEVVPARARLLVTTDVDSLAVLYGRFALKARQDLDITIVDDWKPDVEEAVRESLSRGQSVRGALFLVKAQFELARKAFRLRREGFVYRLEDPRAGADGPVTRAALELAPGVGLVAGPSAGRVVVSPGLATLEASWSLGPGRSIARPGAVWAFRAGETEHWVVQPISGLLDAPPDGLWRDVYRFRLPAAFADRPAEVSVGIVDLDRPPAGLEAFDPASVAGLDFWKERQMQYLIAIRECVPYHATSWIAKRPLEIPVRPVGRVTPQRK